MAANLPLAGTWGLFQPAKPRWIISDRRLTCIPCIRDKVLILSEGNTGQVTRYSPTPEKRMFFLREC
jgi:hypothetical protein